MICLNYVLFGVIRYFYNHLHANFKIFYIAMPLQGSCTVTEIYILFIDLYSTNCKY